LTIFDGKNMREPGVAVGNAGIDEGTEVGQLIGMNCWY
jgi:hypothetical protein